LGDLDNDFENLALWWDGQIQQFNQSNQSIMVACSGHVDSIALFDLIYRFTKLKKKIFAGVIHLNYNLRGQDSVNDQLRIGALCKKHNIPFYLKNVGGKEASCRQGESFQAWARRLRYEFFEEFTKEGAIIALGHHREDLAENVLMRLGRGVSPANMAGMRVVSPPFWRPLLTFHKAQLYKYAVQRDLEFGHDVSNDETTYTRNRIRHDVLPILEELYPGASRRLAQTAQDTEELASAFCAHLFGSERPVDIKLETLIALEDGPALCLLGGLLENAGLAKVQLQREELKNCLDQLRAWDTDSGEHGLWRLAGKAQIVTKKGVVRAEVMPDWQRQRAKKWRIGGFFSFEEEGVLAVGGGLEILHPVSGDKLLIQNEKSLSSTHFRVYAPATCSLQHAAGGDVAAVTLRQLIAAQPRALKKWFVVETNAEFLGICFENEIWRVNEHGKLCSVQDAPVSIKLIEVVTSRD